MKQSSSSSSSRSTQSGPLCCKIKLSSLNWSDWAFTVGHDLGHFGIPGKEITLEKEKDWTEELPQQTTHIVFLIRNEVGEVVEKSRPWDPERDDRELESKSKEYEAKRTVADGDAGRLWSYLMNSLTDEVLERAKLKETELKALETSGVTGGKNTFGLWKLLKANADHAAQTSGEAITQEWTGLKQEQGENLTSFLLRFRQARERVEQAGMTISDADKMIRLARSITDLRFKSTTDTALSTPSTAPGYMSCEGLIERLLNLQDRIGDGTASQPQSSSSDRPSAYSAQQNVKGKPKEPRGWAAGYQKKEDRRSPSKSPRSPRGKKEQKDYSDQSCWNCGETGHSREQCTQPIATCKVCLKKALERSKSHCSEFCPTLKSQKRKIRYSPDGRGKSVRGERVYLTMTELTDEQRAAFSCEIYDHRQMIPNYIADKNCPEKAKMSQIAYENTLYFSPHSVAMDLSNPRRTMSEFCRAHDRSEGRAPMVGITNLPGFKQVPLAEGHPIWRMYLEWFFRTASENETLDLSQVELSVMLKYHDSQPMDPSGNFRLLPAEQITLAARPTIIQKAYEREIREADLRDAELQLVRQAERESAEGQRQWELSNFAHISAALAESRGATSSSSSSGLALKLPSNAGDAVTADGAGDTGEGSTPRSGSVGELEDGTVLRIVPLRGREEHSPPLPPYVPQPRAEGKSSGSERDSDKKAVPGQDQKTEGEYDIMSSLREAQRHGYVVNVSAKGTAGSAAATKHLLDSGATHHLFDDVEYVKSYAIANRDPHVNVSGIDGVPMEVTHTGVIPNMGRFMVVPGIDAVLVSIAELLPYGYRVQFTFEDRGARISREGMDDVLAPLTATNHFALRRDQVIEMMRCTSLQYVAGAASTEDSGLFSAEQRKRATQVIDLHNQFSHVSDDTVIQALNNGCVIGTRLTANDVRVARRLYGPCPSCLAGKARSPSYRSSQNEPAARVAQCIHMDIYVLHDRSVGGFNHYLLAVDEFSGYLTMYPLSSKQKSCLCAALLDLLSDYRRYNHTPQRLQCDCESSLSATDTFLGLNAVRLQQTPPYQHAQRFERYMQTIKARMRCVLSALPYVLPKSLYAELLHCVMQHMNDFPQSQHPTMTPRQVVEGEKLDLNKRLAIPFGTIAMCNIAGKDQDRYAPRAQMAVILGPAKNTYGAVRAYVFDTARIVIRSNVHVLNNFPSSFPWQRKAGTARDADFVGEFLTPLRNDETAFRNLNDAIAQAIPEMQRHSESQHNENSLPENVSVTSTPEYSREGDVIDAVDSAVNLDEIENVHSDSESTYADSDDNLDEIERVHSGSESTHAKQDSAPIYSKLDDIEQSDAVDSDYELDIDAIDTEIVRENAGISADTDAVRNSQSILKKSKPISESKESRKRVRFNKPQSATQRRETQIESQTESGVRRSSRATTSSWKDGPAKMNRILAQYRISVKDALIGDRAQESREAIIDEIMNMLTYKVGHYVRHDDIPLEKRKNILRSFMFLKHKEKPDGSYDKTKARMVGNGRTQKEHLYDLVSSTTVALSTVFMLFNLASHHRARLCSYDIKGAFLHAEFTKDDEVIYIKVNREIAEIWVTIDPAAAEYIDERGELILELDKFIYGLKQSSYKFQMHLQNAFLELGYQRLEQDDCLFIKRAGTDFSILSTHVDDVLQVSNNDAFVDELRNGLIRAYGTVTFHPEADAYLGMTIDRDQMDRRSIHLTQKGLTQKILSKYETQSGGTPARTPAGEDLFAEQDNEEDSIPADRKEFLSLLMSLMYLARITRPDILLPVTYLASKSHNPSRRDMKRCFRVLRYLKGTQNKGIRLYCTDMQIIANCDASYGIHNDGRSHTGYWISIGQNQSYLHGRSGKQKLVSTSSTDAEVIAMVECLKMAVWIRSVLAELAICQLTQIRLYQDNRSAIIMVQDPSRYRRSKHILTKVAYARHLVRANVVQVVYLGTDLLSSDALTKPKQGEKFVMHTEEIMTV